MNTALHTKNLREYMTYASKISAGKSYDINGNFVIYNNMPDSLFNWVFCKENTTEEEVKEILKFLAQKNWEATWSVDVHMTKLKAILEKFGVNMVSAPKKALLNLANFHLTESMLDNSITLIKVDDNEKLHTFDNYTSRIFFHNTGIVTKFLAGLAIMKQDALNAFLVKKGNDFVGTCTLYIEDGTAGFYADGVFREYRNCSIGSQLVLKRIKMAKEMGCKNVIAHSMSASVNLYKRLGFRMVGRLGLHLSEPKMGLLL